MDTLWIAMLVVLTGAGGRLAKLLPGLPKGLMPISVLALGAALYVLKATQIDGLSPAEALTSWQVIVAGASAIVGHDLLKGAMRCIGVNEQLIISLLGSLPKPELKKPIAPPPSTIFVGLGVALAVLLMGCSSARGVADTMAKSANQAKADLLVVYEEEGHAAIPAPDRKTSDKQLAAVRARWAPVWAGFKAFAVVHDRWATAIETGGAVNLEGVFAAFCRLVGLSKPWLELPSVPGFACPEVSP